jgi:hypothetical protein
VGVVRGGREGVVVCGCGVWRGLFTIALRGTKGTVEDVAGGRFRGVAGAVESAVEDTGAELRWAEALALAA